MDMHSHLVAHAVIEPQDASGIAALEITALERYTRGQMLTNNARYALTRADITSLNDLRGWTFADLLKVKDMSLASAKRIEALMAKYGLLLEGGDPAHLEKHRFEPEPISTGPLPDGTPEEIRRRIASDLFDLAAKITNDGASLTKLASLVHVRGDRKGHLKRYIKYQQTGADDVAHIAAPVFAIEALKKERRSKRPSKRPTKAPVADNVVRLSA